MTRKNGKVEKVKITDDIIKILYELFKIKKNIPLDEFKKGLYVELEHGSKLGDKTNITNDDPIITSRIVLAHLKEDPQYYYKLLKLNL